MPQVSIIVPVYNVEKYLPQCIDSLLSQTLKDIEIILINDGSTDSSLKICDQYAEKDQRITIISKKNEGLAKARRDGLKKANAEYISFLDSDDYYEPMFCEIMYTHMVRLKADLVECDYYKTSDSWQKKHELYDADMDLTRELFHNRIVRKTIVNGTEAVVVWNKLYRKCIIERAILEYGNSPLEDYVFNAQYYTMVERYVYIHQCLTNYRQVPMSLSRRMDLKTIEVLKRVEKVKQQCMERMGVNTPDDLSDAAAWFTAYVQSFLLRLLLSKQDNYKRLAMQVVQDPAVKQQCVQSAKQSRFTRAVAAGNGKVAVLCIQKKACLFRLRQLGARYKRVLHQ